MCIRLEQTLDPKNKTSPNRNKILFLLGPVLLLFGIHLPIQDFLFLNLCGNVRKA